MRNQKYTHNLPMNITKYLLALAVPLFFIAAPSASAEPSIPPSEECLLAMDTAIWELQADKGRQANVKAWQKVVDAGCLVKNPMEIEKWSEKDSPECLSRKALANEYFEPINQAAAPMAQKLRQMDLAFLKRAVKIAQKREQARKQGKKKLEAAWNKKYKKNMKRYEVAQKRLAQNNKELLHQYDAPVLLVYADIYTRGCNVGGAWDKRNQNAIAILWLYKYV